MLVHYPEETLASRTISRAQHDGNTIDSSSVIETSVPEGPRRWRTRSLALALYTEPGAGIVHGAWRCAQSCGAGVCFGLNGWLFRLASCRGGQSLTSFTLFSSKLPSWARAVVPKIFYVTEKAWNYYPYTITGEYMLLACSFLPKFSIHIETKYEDNNGSNDNIFGSEAQDVDREVCFVDIAYDEVPERYYKESEDLRYFKSEKTSRGLLKEGWRDSQQPIMCSYKLVNVKFEVWGLQTRVEQFVHKVVRDVLLLGHRQAFAWVDEWIDKTSELSPLNPSCHVFGSTGD
ncbi:Cytoplasmic phosphatidylinositol transfer protein 1 [Acipenser ruthenus]|uniref:Cytoplasmic phosphatidylinositol transfer protein 1 n=1 Tax=Acipenser ruthenus TaxID=7906 RepID=A0A444UNQ4_ACIRT|nr:Cytoplasmic phosphatidylinositol transfer protein 1 [Acipenser ruthenus]